MTERPQQSDNDHQVVPFRPRTRSRSIPGWKRGEAAPNPSDENPTESERDGGHEDYIERMKMNVIAFSFTVVLIAAGMWIVLTLASVRKNQDCYLSGQRNCASISVLPAARE